MGGRSNERDMYPDIRKITVNNLLEVKLST